MLVAFTAVCNGRNQARQEGQYGLNNTLFLINSNWSKWLKAKDEMKNFELKVYFQAVSTAKKSVNEAFCKKCKLTEPFLSPSFVCSYSVLHLSFCFESLSWFLSYSDMHSGVASAAKRIFAVFSD